MNPPKIKLKKQSAASSNKSRSAKANARAKILVIDDDSNSQYALKIILEEHGYQVTFANSGRDGLYQARQLHPDLIFIDMMMPVMDGYEATRRMRKLPGLSTTPIIAMTGQAASTDKNRAIESGCNDYLIKPFHVDQLLAKLGEWLS